MNTTKKWKFSGGHLVLDYINSVKGRVWPDNNPFMYEILEDKFESFTDVIEWSLLQGVLSEKVQAEFLNDINKKLKSYNGILSRMRTLRESLYQVFISSVFGLNPSAKVVDNFNVEFRKAASAQQLVNQDKDLNITLVTNTSDPEFIIRTIVLSAAELIVSGKMKNIKQCPGENCGWLFIDTSKNSSRQWCDMKDCGNLAKVRRFRDKHK